MRHQLLRSVAAGALLAALLSCSDTPKPADTTQPTPTPTACSFAISPATASFASTGGSQVVSVTTTPAGCAPAGWTAAASAGLTLAPTSGSGNGSVTVTAAANSRTAQQTLTATIAEQTFTATLEALACTYTFTANAPDVGADTWTVSSDGSDRRVTVTVSPNDGTCAPWRAVSSDKWVSAEPASGTTSATVQIEFDPNNAATARSASVSFTRPDCTGSNCGLTVKVNQSAPAVFTLNLTLQQGQHLSGPYAGTATGPNGFSCSITQRQETVICPPATFANGAAVPLVVKQTTISSEGNIFMNNTSGCDAITHNPSNGTATCTVNMNADRKVVIGVGCSLFCAGLDEQAGGATFSSQIPAAPAETRPSRRRARFAPY